MTKALRFLFWNAGKLRDTAILGRLVEKEALDFLLLAEGQFSSQELLLQLNSTHVQYFEAYTNCKTLKLFSRFPHFQFSPICESKRYTIRRVRVPDFEDFILGCIHLPSKMHYSAETQFAESELYIREVARVERLLGHSRTIIAGDMNMNPFERPMVNAGGFHAVSSQGVAAKKQRIVQQRQYRMFYNPSWRLLSETKEGVCGTYYYETADHVCYFWNVFDQVVLRPEAMDWLDHDSLAVITESGEISLLNRRGVPDVRYSDHLPIVFSIEPQRKGS